MHAPRTLLTAAAAFAAAGILLLAAGRPATFQTEPATGSPAASAATSTTAPTNPGLDSPSPEGPGAPGPNTAAAPDVPAVPPDPLAGPVPDSYLQQALSETSSPNLPAALEHDLVALATDVLVADLTGDGRNRWPEYFGGTPPTDRYTDVRVQAGIARATNASRRDVEVTLLWAATDPAGDHLERKLATVRLLYLADSWQPRPALTGR